MRQQWHNWQCNVCYTGEVDIVPNYAGGAYGKLDRAVGLERHHMPADSVSPIARARGPAIQMDAAIMHLLQAMVIAHVLKPIERKSVPSLRKGDSVMPWHGK
jgi:hypothetical protein